MNIKVTNNQSFNTRMINKLFTSYKQTAIKAGDRIARDLGGFNKGENEGRELRV